jgi:hypothetical protein
MFHPRFCPKPVVTIAAMCVDQFFSLLSLSLLFIYKLIAQLLNTLGAKSYGTITCEHQLDEKNSQTAFVFQLDATNQTKPILFVYHPMLPQQK